MRQDVPEPERVRSRLTFLPASTRDYASWTALSGLTQAESPTLQAGTAHASIEVRGKSR